MAKRLVASWAFMLRTFLCSGGPDTPLSCRLALFAGAQKIHVHKRNMNRGCLHSDSRSSPARALEQGGKVIKNEANEQKR